MREESRAARLAAAQRALATAEASAGLRQRLTGVTTLAASGSGRAAAAGEGDGGEVGAEATPSASAAAAVPAELLLPVPPGLERLFPAGGLRRGTAVQVSGSTSLLLALAAAAAGGREQDTWCAVVAMPDVGLAAAAEAGLDLERTVVVPSPGPGAAAVLGAVVDGFDVVVLGRCAALSVADRRTATSRLRTREAVLLTCDTWPGAQVVLEVGERSWFGVGAGHGVLTGREMTVTSYARGLATQRSARVRMVAGGGVVPAPAERPAPAVPGGVVEPAEDEGLEVDWARAG